MTTEAQRRQWRNAQRRRRSDPEKRRKIASLRNRERESEREYERRRDLRTWPVLAIRSIRWRAKKENRECTILPQDIIVPDFCPVLGIPLMAGGARDNRPSVDRFDNNRGYTKDNIRVISYRANQLKRDATVDEIRRVLHYMEGVS